MKWKHFHKLEISLSLSFWWPLHAFHKYILFISQIVRLMASGLSDFAFHRGFFSCMALVFWTTLFESTYGRLLLEQYFSFRDLVIRPWSLLQAPSQLNNNSLLKTFFQRSIIWLSMIVIPLYGCYDVTFCIWSLYFVYGEKN